MKGAKKARYSDQFDDIFLSYLAMPSSAQLATYFKNYQSMIDPVRAGDYTSYYLYQVLGDILYNIILYNLFGDRPRPKWQTFCKTQSTFAWTSVLRLWSDP